MKKLFAFLLCTAVFFAMSVTAFADMGPKPSIRITFTGTDELTFYSTMLAKSDDDFIPPGYYAFHGDYDSEDFQSLAPEMQDAVRAFAEYPAPDGYKFFGGQRVWNSQNDSITWGYMPPDEFALLVYFPETGAIAASPKIHAYAFNSYYTADLSTMHDGKIDVISSRQIGTDILKFLVRVLITIALELIVACLFGYLEKRTLLFFAVVNLATQLLLNIILIAANIQYEFVLFLFLYFIGELLVMAGEAVFYAFNIKKYSTRRPSPTRAVVYAVTANIVSLIPGIIISYYQITI